MIVALRIVPLALVVASASAAFAAPAAGVNRKAPPEILVKYSAALAKVHEPKIVVFEYAVEQLGLRNLVQTHRIYRSGARERDETRVVDGYTLNPPTIRTLAVGKNRYAVANIAPRPAPGSFAYAGLSARAGRPQYVFNVRPRVSTANAAAKPFAVDEVEIDSRSYLPTLVRFNVRAGKARGTGEIAFDRAGPHWLVQRAEATITLADGTPARERIVFSAYTFPKQLPPTTFEMQHAPSPGATQSLAAPVPIVGKPTPVPPVIPHAPNVLTPPVQ